MFKAKPYPLYPTRNNFWEISNTNHYSLLNEGATTSWQKSYGTNSSNSIASLIFYFFFLSYNAQDIFSLLHHLLLPAVFCWDDSACWVTVYFLNKLHKTGWDAEISSQHCFSGYAQIDTRNGSRRFLNRPVFRCLWTNCTFKKHFLSKQPYLKPVHSLGVHLV